MRSSRCSADWAGRISTSQRGEIQIANKVRARGPRRCRRPLGASASAHRHPLVVAPWVAHSSPACHWMRRGAARLGCSPLEGEASRCPSPHPRILRPSTNPAHPCKCHLRPSHPSAYERGDAVLQCHQWLIAYGPSCVPPSGRSQERDAASAAPTRPLRSAVPWLCTSKHAAHGLFSADLSSRSTIDWVIGTPPVLSPSMHGPVRRGPCCLANMQYIGACGIQGGERGGT